MPSVLLHALIQGEILLIVTLEDKKVMYVATNDTQEGPSQAFENLESRLSTLRGRKFYGTFQNGEYRACVEIPPDDSPSALGIATWVIPGGKYAREKLKDWQDKVSEIEKIFDSLSKSLRSDPERPSTEFYRSQKELILFLPILD